MIEALLGFWEIMSATGAKSPPPNRCTGKPSPWPAGLDRPKLLEATRTRLIELLRQQNRRPEADAI